jgi:hypothetical protein
LANRAAQTAKGTANGLVLFDTSSNQPKDAGIEAYFRQNIKDYQAATNRILNELGADFTKTFEFRTYSTNEELTAIAAEFVNVKAVFNITHGNEDANGQPNGLFRHAGTDGFSDWKIRTSLMEVFEHDSRRNCHNYGCGMDERGKVTTGEIWNGGSNYPPVGSSLQYELDRL